MEITQLFPESIKIRSKTASFVTDPSANISKTEADAILCLGSDMDIDTSKIGEFRVIISGPGEYEVKGVKISSNKAGIGTFYRLSLDKMDVSLTSASSLSKIENAMQSHVVIINADALPSDKTITAMQPNVVVLYGKMAVEAGKSLKESTAPAVNKFAVTFEKLPAEMEVIVLG